MLLSAPTVKSPAKEGRKRYVSWVPTQSPKSRWRFIFNAAPGAERILEAAFVMIRIVVGAPPQRAARDLTRIDRLHEVAVVDVLRPSVVEGWCRPMRSAESYRARPRQP